MGKMKDISIYFEPVELDQEFKEGTIGKSAEIHDDKGFPEIERNSIAIINVPEYRNGGVSFESTHDPFRSELYDLFIGDSWKRKIYDLGTISPGEKVEDTFFALAQTISELSKNDVIPIIIGGGQDLTLACYRGFENLEQMINICSVDSKLDIGEPNGKLGADGFVSQLLMQRPCYLFNYANIGMQRPLVAKKEIDLFEKLYFDICRLGAYNADFRVAEPFIRNSDILSLDFSSIKNSNSDINKYYNANGFTSEQVCQIAKYAGLSDKLSCLGIFNIIPGHNTAASNLLAQVIWYFIDGVAGRFGDFPIGSKGAYKKFHVKLDDFDDDLVFYKSDKSSRWWLEVKYMDRKEQKYERHCMVPCDQSDYDKALENVIPNLWWKTLQKMS